MMLTQSDINLASYEEGLCQIFQILDNRDLSAL